MPQLSDTRRWLVVFALSALGYAVCAHWYSVTNVDTVAAAWPAWEFAHHGTFYLEASPDLPDNPWFTEQSGHLVSNRMAGVVLIAVPAQALLSPFDLSPLTPAILTAVLVTAAAVANLHLLLRRLTSPKAAGGVTVAIALGTGLWTNASAELWPHGPDAFWLTAAMLALQRHRLLPAGLLLAPALMTRPHLAVVALVVGCWLSLRERSVRPLLSIGIPAWAGIGAVFAWHSYLFGEPSLSGGYQDTVGTLTDTGSLSVSGPTPLRLFLDSAAGSLVSPLHGFLVYSPFLLVGVASLAAGLRRAPAWAGAAALGGLGYQLVQWKLNSFTGGTGLYSYRLPLEMIVLCTPVALLGYQRLRAAHPLLQPITRTLVGLSVGIHAIGVFWFQPLGANGQVLDPWRSWGTGLALTSRGTTGTVVAVVMLLAVVTAAHLPWRRLVALTPGVTSGAPSGSPARPTQDLPVGV